MITEGTGMQTFIHSLLFSLVLILGSLEQVNASGQSSHGHKMPLGFAGSMGGPARHTRVTRNRIRPPEGYRGLITFIENGMFDANNRIRIFRAVSSSSVAATTTTRISWGVL